jgi:hypothetical protein
LTRSHVAPWSVERKTPETLLTVPMMYTAG